MIFYNGVELVFEKELIKSLTRLYQVKKANKNYANYYFIVAWDRKVLLLLDVIDVTFGYFMNTRWLNG